MQSRLSTEVCHARLKELCGYMYTGICIRPVPAGRVLILQVEAGYGYDATGIPALITNF